MGYIGARRNDGAGVEGRVANALGVAEEAFDAQNVLAPGGLRSTWTCVETASDLQDAATTGGGRGRRTVRQSTETAPLG